MEKITIDKLLLRVIIRSAIKLSWSVDTTLTDATEYAMKEIEENKENEK